MSGTTDLPMSPLKHSAITVPGPDRNRIDVYSIRGGVIKPIFSVPLIYNFFKMIKTSSSIWYHVHIWQVSPQLSCGDPWHIWTWFEVSNLYFAKKKKKNGEINERSFSDTPGQFWPGSGTLRHVMFTFQFFQGIKSISYQCNIFN